jgi:alanyl-tRNA synthetase
VAHDYGAIYPEINDNIDYVIEQLKTEEIKFNKTIERGLKEFEKIHSQNIISGPEAFDLYQSYGFPIEMTRELAAEQGLTVDEAGYAKAAAAHQELSRTASAGIFKGGLADAGEETKKLHTAAHLMLAALRQVLGGHVAQKGSNITAERLRFDFSHSEKMTLEQISRVESLVNEAINKDLPVICKEMSLDQAREKNAMGVFDSKYGEKVKVYSIGAGQDNFSQEICGGPHVEHTGLLGKFKIQKEESSSAGVRRIKAVLYPN